MHKCSLRKLHIFCSFFVWTRTRWSISVMNDRKLMRPRITMRYWKVQIIRYLQCWNVYIHFLNTNVYFFKQRDSEFTYFFITEIFYLKKVVISSIFCLFTRTRVKSTNGSGLCRFLVFTNMYTEHYMFFCFITVISETNEYWNVLYCEFVEGFVLLHPYTR